MPTALIVLAAGKGTRMNSDLPKVLHPLACAPLLVHAMRAGESCDTSKTIVVAGHGAEAVCAAATDHNPEAEVVIQTEQLGTAHAVDQARGALTGFSGDVIVLYGDTPFIRPETLEQMLKARADGNAVVVLGFEAADPGRYGRLIMNGAGDLDVIVEAKDATPKQLEISLCNSGVVCANAEQLFDLISKISNNNASGEYYLTDVVGCAVSAGLNCTTVVCNEEETLGVDSKTGLARAEAAFQRDARLQAMENGVTLTAPETVFFAYDTVVGRDVTIAPNVVFGPDVTIESGATINAFCHLEGCHISKDAVVGPFARLRPGAELGNDARVGNFVEIKNAILGDSAKVNHLSYVGDAEVGENANIGAGTITCNYDGVMKHKTKIGARAFIGSNTSLIAPVSVGNDALTGSGSVIDKEVPDDAIAISRTEQKNLLDQALRRLDRLKHIKVRKTKER